MSEPVALVHDWLTGQRGGEHVLRALAGVFPDAPIYTLFHFPGSVDAEIEAHRIATSFLQRAPAIEEHYRWYLPIFPVAVEDLDVRGHRLVISSSHCVAKSVRKGPGARHVCYCHTPMRYAWDQEEAYFGTGTGPLARLRRRILAALRRWDVATAGRVDTYLANSSFVADRIRRYYGRPAEVLPPPVDTDFFTLADPAVERLGALVVAALSPYKKVDLAIQACARAGVPLTVVGTGPELPALRRMAGDSVRFEGRVEPDRLRELYRCAEFFLQPGVEDFGISTVEALACGTPILALDAGGVRDIVRPGEHGLFFAQDEASEIAAAIDKIRRMQFNPLNLRERAEIFAAKRFAHRLREILVADWPYAEDLIA